MVKLEGFVAGINGNRNWTDFGNSALQRHFVSSWDIDATGDGGA